MPSLTVSIFGACESDVMPGHFVVLMFKAWLPSSSIQNNFLTMTQLLRATTYGVHCRSAQCMQQLTTIRHVIMVNAQHLTCPIHHSMLYYVHVHQMFHTSNYRPRSSSAITWEWANRSTMFKLLSCNGQTLHNSTKSFAGNATSQTHLQACCVVVMIIVRCDRPNTSSFIIAMFSNCFWVVLYLHLQLRHGTVKARIFWLIANASWCCTANRLIQLAWLACTYLEQCTE